MNIQPELLAAFGFPLAATLGAHLGIVRKLEPPGYWHLDDPRAGVVLYALGAAMCASLTYAAWCELLPPASVAISIAWGFAHPLATIVATWWLGRKAPGLARKIQKARERDEHEDGGRD